MLLTEPVPLPDTADDFADLVGFVIEERVEQTTVFDLLGLLVFAVRLVVCRANGGGVGGVSGLLQSVLVGSGGALRLDFGGIASPGDILRDGVAVFLDCGLQLTEIIAIASRQ